MEEITEPMLNTYYSKNIMQKCKRFIVPLTSMLIMLYVVSCTNRTKSEAISNKVTFIELGSVKCIPCQKMQTVMKSVEKKYGEQVEVIFYDVWTPEGKPYADKYKIQAIPTQVFLDQQGNEYFRHEGYFPEEELVKVLNKKISLEPISTGT
jgi:thioredoxin 1